MGTIIASNVFQCKLDSIYIGLPGVTGIADDVIVYGADEEEHDCNLLRFLDVTRKNGLHLNKDKLQFKKREVSYFGHCWSADGISPDPKKIDSFLGLVSLLPKSIFSEASRVMLTIMWSNSERCTLQNNSGA